MLKNKVALVTGSSGGIGAAIAEVFLEQGAFVYAHARKRDERFMTWVDLMVARFQDMIVPVFFDITDPDAMRREIQAIRGSARVPSVLVNNAGVAHGGLFQMTGMKKIREVFDVNFFAQIELIQQVARILQRSDGASVVNVCSIAGEDLSAGNIAYGVSKAALSAATRTLAAEFGRLGVRVNAVSPGLTETDMAEQMSTGAAEEMISRCVMRRLCHPREVANVVAFLASDLASFVNSQVVRVDGGMF